MSLVGTTQVVRIDQLRVDIHRNPRLFMTSEHVGTLMQSIEKEGQIQEVNATVFSAEEGKLPIYAVVCGFTRTEAFRRLIYKTIVSKYNKEKAPEVPLSIEKRDDCKIAGETYPEEFEKLLNKYTIRIYIPKNDGEKTDLVIRAIRENNDRKSMSVWENMMAIENLIKDGMTAVKIGSSISMSGGQVSQFRQSFRVVNNIPSWFSTPDSWETFDETKKAEQYEIAERLVKELKNRIQGVCDKDVAVGLSHMREFSARVDRGEDGGKTPKISRKLGMDALAKMTGANYEKLDYEWMTKKDGLPTNGPLVYSVFLSELKAAEELTSGYRQGKNLTAADTETKVTTEVEVGGKEVTAGTIANQAAEAVATIPSPANVPVSTGNKEEESIAKTEEANASSVSNIGGIPITDDEVDILDKTKGKSLSAPIENVKLQSTDMIVNTEGHTMFTYSQYTETAVEEQEVGLALISLGSLVQVKGILGKSKESSSIFNKATEFAQEIMDYIGNLESFKSEVLKKNPKIQFAFLARPELPTIDGMIPQINEEAEESFDDFSEPTDEELETLENN